MTSKSHHRGLASARCESIESRLLLSVARPSYNTGTGFFVSGGNIYDANGNPFIMKGINAIHAWGSYNNNYATIDQLAKTGANAVRAVMYEHIATDATNPYTDAADTPARRQAVVERYLANGMVVVVEDHASITTNADATDPNALADVTTHWLDDDAWLVKYQSGVILNIANEWGPIAGASGSNTVWRDSYISQVQRLRQGPDGVLGTADDINNLIEIDAAGYGQDYNSLALHAQQVEDADPQHNIVFSIHLYGNWRDESRPWEVAGGNTDYGPWDIATKLGALRNRVNPLPLVIGEFAWEDFRDFSSTSAPYANYRTQRVLQIADQLGIGWTGWSYNQSSPLTLNVLAGSLNNTSYGSNADLSDWGDELINDPIYGLKATAQRATVFPIANLPPAPAGLPALPAAPPPTTRIILEKTRGRVPEGGQAAFRVKLSAAPTADVIVSLAKVAGGDADISLATSSLMFTSANWNQYQTFIVGAAPDADSAAGSARIQLIASGIVSNDITIREIDAQLPLGSVTLNPTADRRYADGNTAASVSINSTSSPQPTGALFMKFDASGLGGKVSSATLRVFKTSATTNATFRLYLALTDSWTEASTTGIHASIPLFSQVVPNAANVYVSFDVTSVVQSEMYKDGLITFALGTASGSATIVTREGTSPPQLAITTVSAVPPQLVASNFDYSSSVNKLTLQFSGDVSSTLSSDDISIDDLTDPFADPPFISATPTYDHATNTATFAFSPGVVANGSYRVTVFSGGISDANGNAMLANSSFTFFSLAGDANHNGVVDFDDLVSLAQNYGQPDRVYAQGDFNGDGQVDFDDLVILAQNYGQSVTLPAITTNKQPTKGRTHSISADILA